MDDKLDLGKVGEGGYSYTVHGQEPIDHDDTSNDYNHLFSALTELAIQNPFGIVIP